MEGIQDNGEGICSRKKKQKRRNEEVDFEETDKQWKEEYKESGHQEI